jgi:hypothetical protein
MIRFHGMGWGKVLTSVWDEYLFLCWVIIGYQIG